MPRLVFAGAFVLWILGGVAAFPRADSSQAASTVSVRTWIGRESQIEEQLKTAVITKLEDIGTGVTRPQLAHVEPTGNLDRLVWKELPPGRKRGYWESYKSEVAAYELDKLLRMQLVPPAVERRVDGEPGAAVMWIGGIQSVKELGGEVPSGAVWAASIRQMQMFDNLIGNPDRNAGNILIGPPGEMVLIDHSRAFITDTDLPQKFERVDARLWERVKALTRAELNAALGSWLDDDAIDAIVERRDRMAEIVAKLVAEKGPSQVIIP